MLLIIEALLLILAALGQDHRAAVERLKLDMALQSVDDQYNGCKPKMAHLVKTKHLMKEINSSPQFKIGWQVANMFVKFPKSYLTKNHLIAIYVYSDNNVYHHFNPATRNGKKLYKNKTYKWYSLYFLLTEAIQTLKKTQYGCRVTYRGTSVEFNKYVLNKEVRFGSFASSSLERKIAQGFGSKSCFEIYTCHGADVSKYSKYPHEREVLIPPYMRRLKSLLSGEENISLLSGVTLCTL